MIKEFENFTLDLARRMLCVHGQEVILGGRAFEVLTVLAEHYQQVVTKNTLIERVWPGLVVTDNNLPVQIANLRKVLGRNTIATASGRGYRLMSNLLQVSPAAQEPPAPPSETAPDRPSRFTAPHHADGQLPMHTPTLYGRDEDLLALTGLLQSHRLVTLTGAGGIGKTHLAHRVGMAPPSACKDGVWRINAESCTDLPSLTQMAIHRLKVAVFEDLARQDDPEFTAVRNLCKALEDKSLLLIVDNCEHILAAAQTFLTLLLAHVPGLRLLVTSQTPLRLVDEHVYQLGPLSLPGPEDSPEQARQSGALQLFLGRLQQLHQRYAELGTQDLAHAVAICQQLDGMALALLLAAARVPSLGLKGVREHLSDDMTLLDADLAPGQPPHRHLTLQAVIDWTYRLLEPQQAQAFECLGLFVGSFDLETAQQLLADKDTPPWHTLKKLDTLLEHGLLTVADDGSERYRLLQPHRLFALHKLQQGQDWPHWQRHFARTMLARSDTLIRQRDTSTFWANIAHLNAALEWACAQPDPNSHETAVALAVNTAMLLLVNGQAKQALDNLRRVGPWVASHPSPWRRAKYWQWLGRMGTHGRLPTSESIAALEKAEIMYQQLRSPRHIHACKRMLAEARLDQGQWHAAQTTLAQAQAMETAQTPMADSMRRLRLQGLVAQRQGQLQTALHALQSALSLAQMAQLERYELTLQLDIARLNIESGHLEQSLNLFAHLKHTGHRHFYHHLTLGATCADWALALLQSGDCRQAAEVCLYALTYWYHSGLLLRQGYLFAGWFAQTGNNPQAIQWLAMADQWFHKQELGRDFLQEQARKQAMEAIARQTSEGDLTSLLQTASTAPMPEMQLVRYLESQMRAALTPSAQAGPAKPPAS